MTDGPVDLRVLVPSTSVLALTLSMALAPACSQKHRAIETLPDRTVNEDGGRRPGDDGRPSGDLPQAGNTATFVTRIAETELAKYVDVNAKLDYELSYLDLDESGTVQLTGGEAEIRIEGLPVGKSGELVLELYESGELKLRGSQADLALEAGTNTLPFTLKTVGSGGAGGDGNGDGNGNGNGNGGTEAELVLQISIEDGGGDPNSGGSGTGGGGGGGGTGSAASFADIQPIAGRACSGCHAKATDETWWRDKAREIAGRLDTSNPRVMPQKGSAEDGALSAADRKKLLDWVTR